MQLFILAAAVLVTLLVLHASSPAPRQETGAPPLPPEVQRLQAWVGTWDAEVTMMGQTTKGSETCRVECGGHWLVTEHTGSFMGVPFQGKGLTGFDASKGAYSGVWIDSSGSPMSVFTDGTFSADGKRCTAHVDTTGMDGRPGRFEYVWGFPDVGSRTFEVFQVDGGKRELVMSVRYAKRG